MTLPPLVPVRPPATTLPLHVPVQPPVPLLQAPVSAATRGVVHQVIVIHQ
jgi:hypothetical protein